MTTSLNALQSDQFELANLVRKKLILVNDTKGVLNDASIVNAYSGQDSLRGRMMHTQGTNSITPEGIMFFVENTPLEVEDAGGGPDV